MKIYPAPACEVDIPNVACTVHTASKSAKRTHLNGDELTHMDLEKYGRWPWRTSKLNRRENPGPGGLSYFYFWTLIWLSARRLK